MNRPLVTGPEYVDRVTLPGLERREDQAPAQDRAREVAVDGVVDRQRLPVGGDLADALEPAEVRPGVGVAPPEGVGRQVVEAVVVLGEAVAAGRDRGAGEVRLRGGRGASSRGSRWSSWSLRWAARSGRLAVDEPAAVADRAQVVLRVLGVADHAAVVDQQHVRRVHLVGLEQAEEQVVRLVGGRLRREQPDPLATTRSTWRSTGISGVPKQNSSTIEAVFLPMPSIGGEPVARLERRQVAEELERVVAALLADVAQRRLEPGRLLRPEAARPDDVDELGERRVLDRRPVRRRRGRQAVAAPADARACGPPGSRSLGYARPQRLERLLGVDVGGVLGEDREDQLARRVEARSQTCSPYTAVSSSRT